MVANMSRHNSRSSSPNSVTGRVGSRSTLAPGTRIAELADSKLLTAAARERVEARVKRLALAWAVACVEVDELDEIGLHRGNLLAFRRAWLRLPELPDYAEHIARAIPTH